MIQPDALTIELLEGYRVKSKIYTIIPIQTGDIEKGKSAIPSSKEAELQKRIPLLGQNVLTHIFNACFFLLINISLFQLGNKLNWNVSDPELTNWKLENKLRKKSAILVHFQLGYQFAWEMITLWSCYTQVPVEDDGMQVDLENITSRKCMIFHMFTWRTNF